MARKKSEEAKREETRKNLEELIKEKGKIEPIYRDKVEEYMSFYDNLKTVEKYLKELEYKENEIEKMPIKIYTETVSEKRRISSEMRNILTYLGIKPDQNRNGAIKDEEL